MQVSLVQGMVMVTVIVIVMDTVMDTDIIIMMKSPKVNTMAMAIVSVKVIIIKMPKIIKNHL